MPTKTAAPGKTATGRATARRNAPPAALFQPAEPDALAPAPAPVPAEDATAKAQRLVGGLKVIGEEDVPSPLPTRHRDGSRIKFSGFGQLLLEDGSKVFGCRDCVFTSELQGHMVNHRHEEHPKPVTRVDRRKKHELPPPTHETLDVHREILAMTFGDVIEAVGMYYNIGETSIALQAEVGRLRAELAAQTALLNDAEKKIEKLSGAHEKATAATAELRKIQAALAKAGFVLKVDDDE